MPRKALLRAVFAKSKIQVCPPQDVALRPLNILRETLLKLQTSYLNFNFETRGRRFT